MPLGSSSFFHANLYPPLFCFLHTFTPSCPRVPALLRPKPAPTTAQAVCLRPPSGRRRTPTPRPPSGPAAQTTSRPSRRQVRPPLACRALPIPIHPSFMPSSHQSRGCCHPTPGLLSCRQERGRRAARPEPATQAGGQAARQDVEEAHARQRV